MSALDEVFAAYVEQLGDVLGATEMRVKDDLAATVEARDVVFGPPSFAWEGLCSPDEPSSMTFQVYLIEASGERAIERLLKNLPALLSAVGSLGDDTTVTGAVPGSFPTAGADDLPCYQITAEAAL